MSDDDEDMDISEGRKKRQSSDLNYRERNQYENQGKLNSVHEKVRI